MQSASLHVPVEDENTALVNSHREGSSDRILRQHKVKAAVGILFVVVVALVGLSNTQSKTSSQMATSAYMEAQDDVIAPGVKVLSEVAIQGVSTGAYLTHSSNIWQISDNVGIFAVSTITREEQWDIHYLDDIYGKYYKMIHSHDNPMYHWLMMQGNAPTNAYNPSVLQGQQSYHDKDGYLRWNLALNADGTNTVTGTPALNTNYYLVNRVRDRCVSIISAVPNPTTALPTELQNSVTSAPKDASGNFPATCVIRFVDAAGAPAARGFFSMFG